MTSGAVLHVPHSSSEIPSDIRDRIRLSDAELGAELLRMTDWYTDELFNCATLGLPSVVFPVSRLVVDPERFESDDEERMAQVGMGVIYQKTSHGSVLRFAPTGEERTGLLTRFYRPHHQSLTMEVERLLGAHGQALIIDCHSFPSRPLPYELDQNSSRPDICLGTDSFHTPAALLSLANGEFIARGYSIAVDRPFSGALVPSKHYLKDSRVSAIMIEVNRSVYMDEEEGGKCSHFSQVVEDISGVVATLCASAIGERERG
jgi:N-formylglutamate deformylase